ncbi:hypothetical protein [Candidatus Orientia mediorientalis]|nr:hypothetical protein [Candidatus Orientia mediorientalis]
MGKLIHNSDSLKDTILSKTSEAEYPPKDVMVSALNLAYKIGYSSYNEEYEKISGILKNKGWKVLCTSAEGKDTSRYGYKAVALINQNTGQVHIATAGTKPMQPWDLFDDMKIYFHSLPWKMDPMKCFINKILKQLDQDTKNYIFSTSGHSLGAIMSDLTMGECISQNLKFTKSITFENPGSRPIVDRAIKNHEFTNKIEMPIEALAKHCIIVNAKRNFINLTNRQLGSEIKLMLVKNKSTTNKHISNSAQRGNWINKFCSAIRNCMNYFKITAISDQINDHKLANFDNQDSGKELTEFTVQNWDKDLLVLDGKTAQKAKNIASTGNEGIIMEEEIDSPLEGSKQFIGYRAYTHRDLCRMDSEPEPITNSHKKLQSKKLYTIQLEQNRSNSSSTGLQGGR